MSTASGARLTPARLNPVAFQLQLTANQPLTGTPTNLALANVTPGFSGVTYTVPAGGMTGLAVWQADFTLVTAGTITLATVELTIDGGIPTNSPAARWDPGNVTDAGATIPASWPFVLTAGPHTFGLLAAIAAGTGTARLNAKHTALSILLHP